MIRTALHAIQGWAATEALDGNGDVITVTLATPPTSLCRCIRPRVAEALYAGRPDGVIGGSVCIRCIRAA